LESSLAIETPRDREGTFEPQLVKKRQVRLAGMEEKILALYAKGLTTRDIESVLVDCPVQVSKPPSPSSGGVDI